MDATTALIQQTSPVMATTLEEPAYSSQDQSRLLSLPPELRNRIWRLVLVKDHSINILWNIGGVQKPTAGRSMAFVHPDELPYLSQSCRQIRAETNAIYFEENKFCLQGAILDDNFLSSLELWCGASAARIRQIDVSEYFTAIEEQSRQLCSCRAQYTLCMTAQGHVSIYQENCELHLSSSTGRTPACACRLRRVVGYWNDQVDSRGEEDAKGQDTPFAFLQFLALMSEDHRPRLKRGRSVEYGAVRAFSSTACRRVEL